jgi:hypothetical protein
MCLLDKGLYHSAIRIHAKYFLMHNLPEDESPAHPPKKRENKVYTIITNDMFTLIRLSGRGNNGTYQGFQSNHSKLILHNTLIPDKNNITNLQRITDCITYRMINNILKLSINTNNRKSWFVDLKGTRVPSNKSQIYQSIPRELENLLQMVKDNTSHDYTRILARELTGQQTNHHATRMAFIVIHQTRYAYTENEKEVRTNDQEEGNILDSKCNPHMLIIILTKSPFLFHIVREGSPCH